MFNDLQQAEYILRWKNVLKSVIHGNNTNIRWQVEEIIFLTLINFLQLCYWTSETEKQAMVLYVTCFGECIFFS